MHIILTEDFHTRKAFKAIGRTGWSGYGYARGRNRATRIAASHRTVYPKIMRVAVHINYRLRERDRACPYQPNEISVAGLCIALAAFDEPFERICLGCY